ncbi:MAG: DUF882 domain-containing protein [Reyranellaceae bacterium]
MTKGSTLGRRAFLSFSAAATVALSSSSLLAAPAVAGKATAAGTRTFSFVNLNTTESGKLLYWENGQYIDQALQDISQALRDPHNGQVHQISPQLLDLVVGLQRKLNTANSVHIVSAFRSQETNDEMAAKSRGVAKRSYHLDGMAIDLRVPGRGLNQVRGAALQLAGGGVGYYPRSNFVHVDVGPVRRW